MTSPTLRQQPGLLSTVKRPPYPKGGDGPVEATRMLRVVRRWNRPQSPNPGRQPTARSGSNRPRAAQTSAPGALNPDPDRRLCPLPSSHSTDHDRVCEDGSGAPGPPIPKPGHRDHTGRQTDPRSLRTGQPGAARRLRSSNPTPPVALLTAAGDNPGRMNTNTAFAALCAPSPVPASSGRTVRHRLNRGGNRQANNALWPGRYQPDASRPTHQRICHQTTSRRKNPPRDPPLPETAHRPRRLPPPHRPAPNTPRNRPTPPPNPSPNHPHPHRPPARHTTHRPIPTRARPLPQPSPRYPIPATAQHPPTDLQNIGASWVGWGEILGMGLRPRWNR